MAPAVALQNPLRWLRAIARFRATHSGGPNFAFEQCLQRVGPEGRAGLDLSSWVCAFCGAEPVQAGTFDRFASAFEPCGFRRRAFTPCYGLAETTLMASSVPWHAAAAILDVSAEALASGPWCRSPSRAAAGELRSRRRPPASAAIVDSVRERVRRERWAIWVSGPSVPGLEPPAGGFDTFGARLEGRADVCARDGHLTASFSLPAGS
jgi:acyl-CoA synthetase (AMP-forming)/AMP-acid ligase II